MPIGESPEYVRTSTAADIVLGFSPGKFYRNAVPYCINLLLYFKDGCKANCLYCGQAREVAKDAACKTLIRVEWPLRKLDNVIASLKKILRTGCSFRPYRVCVATITNPKAVEAEIEVIRKIYHEVGMPISALITPTLFHKEEMKKLREAGAERIGIAIDCATPQIFDLLRGKAARGPHRWQRYLQGVEEAVQVMNKGKVGIHLIVGLGETEKQAVELIQKTHDMGAETHLFSFYPEEGSVLEKWPRPPISQYRRIQLARYLINNEITYAENMKYNQAEQIIDYGISKGLLADIIETGQPFITSGCPGCNRPYSNEKPSEFPRNFPYPPTRKQIQKIKQQLQTYKLSQNTVKDLKKYLVKYNY